MIPDIDYLIETYPRARTRSGVNRIWGVGCFAAEFALDICFDRSGSCNLEALLTPSERRAHRVSLRADTLGQKFAFIARSLARHAVPCRIIAAFVRVKLASRTICAFLRA